MEFFLNPHYFFWRSDSSLYGGCKGIEMCRIRHFSTDDVGRQRCDDLGRLLERMKGHRGFLGKRFSLRAAKSLVV